MSSREPMWYCHQCHLEMRPQDNSNEQCALCHGEFIEKIEDTANHPREFAAGGGPGDLGDEDDTDPFFFGLQTLLNRGMQPNWQRNTMEQPGQRSQSGSRVALQFSSSGPRQTSFTFRTSPGSPNLGSPPTMSDTRFIRRAPSSSSNDDDNPSAIPGSLLAHYILSLLGQADHSRLTMLTGGMPEGGRMGDYVFSQEALDQIMSQIMENSNSHRPVPASEEIIQKLPREVLMEGSPLLSRDCAVCKDQFQLGTEDPDEQIIVKLPCEHPFHQSCILPWLKSSATCPVCRYALVPQPNQNAPMNPTSSTSSSTSQFNTNSNVSSTNNSNQSSRMRSGGRPSESHRGNILSQFLRNFTGPTHSQASSSSSNQRSSPTSPGSTSTRTRDQARHTRRPSSDSPQQQSQRPRNRNNGGSGEPHVPGQWSDDVMDLD